MSKPYWSTKQLRIELQPSVLTVMLLVIIHMLGLLALACSDIHITFLVVIIAYIGVSFYYSLSRYGLLLSRHSIDVLEFKQQRWRLKLRADSTDQPASVAGRLAFGIVMLEVRGAESSNSSFVVLTKSQLCPEQFRILKGLVISAKSN